MKKILVIDDIVNIQELLSDILNANGYEVEAVSSANEGLKIIQHKNIDLVVTDLKMPEITGLELIRRLRESNINIPTLAISGHEGHIEELRNNGFVATSYLLKPFTEEELLKEVHLLLK